MLTWPFGRFLYAFELTWRFYSTPHKPVRIPSYKRRGHLSTQVWLALDDCYVVKPELLTNSKPSIIMLTILLWTTAYGSTIRVTWSSSLSRLTISWSVGKFRRFYDRGGFSFRGLLSTLSERMYGVNLLTVSIVCERIRDANRSYLCYSCSICADIYVMHLWKGWSVIFTMSI